MVKTTIFPETEKNRSQVLEISEEMLHCTPQEVLMFRTEHSPEEIEWAKEVAAYYCCRPLKTDAANFYTFIADVFHAGRISGIRKERARRAHG